jgi:hypothetical protein
MFIRPERVSAEAKKAVNEFNLLGERFKTEYL